MRNGISPLSKGRGLFHRIGNFVPYTMKPSGGCALRAKEDGCWRQPCSGAENPAEPDSFFCVFIHDKLQIFNIS